MGFSAWGRDERRVIRLSSCVLRRGKVAWPYMEREAASIETHWQHRLSTHPRMFNGVVQLLARAELHGDRLSGEFLTTDFKSFLHWKDQGYRDDSVRDAFGSALLVSADGYVLLGRQGGGQLNSGLAYLPGGFIDARDVARDGSVGIEASAARELEEETGLGAGDIVRVPGAILTLCGMLASIAIVYRSGLDSRALGTRIRAHIQTQDDAELEDIVLVGRRSDLEGVALADYAAVLMATLFPGTGERLAIDAGG